MEQFEDVRQAISAENFKRAEGLLGHSENPESEWLYLKAVCCRGLGKLQDGLACLDQLIAMHPKHGRAFQERGRILLALGRTQDALTALGRATQENPSLHYSWAKQAEILLSQRRFAEAERIKPHIERLAALPKPLVYVLDIMSQGAIAKAEIACRDFLKTHPHHVEGMRLLAEIAIKLNVLDEAEFLLESAVLFEPANQGLKVEYISCLRKRQKLDQAKACALELFNENPTNLHYMSQYAVICMQLGEYDVALDLFNKVLRIVPGEPVTLTSKGHALKTIGQTDDAIKCYREACREGVIHGEAWQSLANLKTYKFNDAEILRMSKLAQNTSLRLMDRVYLYFALGKALEDKKDFAKAFEMYQAGNAIKRAESRYVAEHMTEEFSEQRKVFSNLSTPHFGLTAADPIFVVGMPRAGSTLIEQILSSHSMVDGTQELPNILAIVHQLRNQEKDFDRLTYPRAIEGLDAHDLKRLGEKYIEGTRSYREDAPHFIDKMPNNFRHIGLIKLILPNTKIIDARRHPLSCTFSCYKQLFAEGQEFSYDLSDLGKYYRDYVNLMDYWHHRFPGEILHVQYEDVVDDLEGQVRRLLDYCGLPFEEACINYWQTDRAVKTPSSEQVRQPIFRSGVENWQYFEPYLDELKLALGPALTAYKPKHTATALEQSPSRVPDIAK